jgi:hypothetical protein
MNTVAVTIFFNNIVDRVVTFVVQTAVVVVYDHIWHWITYRRVSERKFPKVRGMLP